MLWLMIYCIIPEFRFRNFDFNLFIFFYLEKKKYQNTNLVILNLFLMNNNKQFTHY